MARASKPDHFVVDGSNIATEGRSAPSLEQLNEAVLAFMEDHPGAIVTVVVDATFGHRIATKEVKAFDEAVANNELVTPPAGAVGRGDAFLLTIADKAGAGVLSNDSFQEFHGEYDWLFDEGRLIGGKPVPHVGWVFVARTPVRGPKSRRAVREAKDVDRQEAKQLANRRVRAKSASPDSPDTSDVEPVGAAPDSSPVPQQQDRPASRRRGGRKQAVEPAAERAVEAQVETASAPAPPRDHVNDLMPFLDFVERHPVGTSCTAVVESYASHGAYARSGDALIYLPLRLLDSPAPRSARSVLDIGESVTVVVVGFTPDRRSIDAAMPHMAADLVKAASAHQPAPSSRSKGSPEQPAATKKAAAAKPAAATKATTKATAKPAATKQAAAKSAATKQAAAKSAATTSASTKAGATTGDTVPDTRKRRSQAAEVATPSSAGAKQTPAKRAAAATSATKKAATKQSGAKPAVEKAAAKPAKKPTAAKPTVATTQGKPTAAAKPAAAKSAGKTAVAKQGAARTASAKQTARPTAKKSNTSRKPPS